MSSAEAKRYQEAQLLVQLRMAKSTEEAVSIARTDLAWAFRLTCATVVISLLALIAAWRSVDVSQESVGVSQKSLDASQESVRIGADSLRLAQESLAIDARPWLSIDYSSDTDPDGDGGPIWDLQVTQSLSNFGRTPVTNGVIATRLFPQVSGQATANIRDLVRDMCTAIEDGRSYVPEKYASVSRLPNVFPSGEPLETSGYVHVSRSQVEALYGDVDYLWFTLVGCVRYQSLVGTQSGETPFAFDVISLPNCDYLPTDEEYTESLVVFRDFSWEHGRNPGDPSKGWRVCLRPLLDVDRPK